jgi:hypothetical protein
LEQGGTKLGVKVSAVGCCVARGVFNMTVGVSGGVGREAVTGISGVLLQPTVSKMEWKVGGVVTRWHRFNGRSEEGEALIRFDFTQA